MSHKVLLAIPNPFVKAYPYQGSKPCLVWLTRDDLHDGRGMPGTHYLFMVYRFDGTVKWQYELNVLNRAHRLNKKQRDAAYEKWKADGFPLKG